MTKKANSNPNEANLFGFSIGFAGDENAFDA